MDAADRYKDEQRFTDTSAEKILAKLPDDWHATDIETFEQLCDKREYLNSVPEFIGPLSGKKVLELGCGDGWISLRFASSGAKVWAIDLSPKMIELAQRYARGANLDINFEPMIVEQLSYDDNFFDIVFMHMALHHCDIPATAEQIRRVLKPGGKAVIIEDYAYHPVMRVYRRLTPSKHTHDEHPLNSDEVARFVSFFSEHTLAFSGLINIFETENGRLVTMSRPTLRRIDAFLYAHCESLKKYSRMVIIKAIK